MEPRILHIDMDAFFASVEQVRDPGLVGKPLIIGGDKESRGVVSTASYEARKYGVHSAMPMAEAVRRCPHAIFMRGNYALYSAASREVKAVLDTVSPLVQMASIDEAYVDVTGSQKLFGGDDAIAAYIKGEIRRRTQLPCTVAIAPNKLVAKVASDEGKPDGYVRVSAGEERAYLAPLPVRKIPGAGPRTCAVLESMGVLTAGQLAEMPLPALERIFGTQMAAGLQRAARGIASAEVEVDRAPKSVSRETTFARDLTDWGEVERVIACLTERAAYALREERLETRRVTLKVRYAGFDTHTFSKALAVPTCVDHDIAAALRELATKARQRRARVRLVGVHLGALSFNQHQLQLFGRQESEKWEQVLERMDAVRGKHGFGALRFGRTIGSNPGREDAP
jgi:DNA polymerase-4